MASSSEIFTAAGFWGKRLRRGGRRLAWGGDCAPAAAQTDTVTSKNGKRKRCKRMGGQPLKEGRYTDWRAMKARKRGGWLCGGAAHRKPPDGGIWGEVITLRFRPRPRGNRNTHTNA
jgi:hypothetical protein